MWELYDALLEPIDESLKVKNVLQGKARVFVQVSDGSFGIAASNRGEGFLESSCEDLRGKSLKEVASLIKSWNILDASIGVAALNAFYNQQKRIGKNLNGSSCILPGGNSFFAYKEAIKNKKVCTVGHFRFVKEMSLEAKEWVVFERSPKKGDLPDTAAEYIIPEMDYVFITGCTIANKSLPRLLEISRGKEVILVGGSVPLSPVFFDFGVREVGGSYYEESLQIQEIIERGGSLIGKGIPMRIGVK